MNQYRGIFTSERHDGRCDVVVDDGISITPNMPVAVSFPAIPSNTIGKVSHTESVVLPDGTKARRAYFETDKTIWPGMVPGYEGRLLMWERAFYGQRIITSYLVTGIVLRPDPVGYDADLEILDGDTWRVVTPPREVKPNPC